MSYVLLLFFCFLKNSVVMYFPSVFYVGLIGGHKCLVRLTCVECSVSLLLSL